MSTIGYENWAVDLAEVTAIYPMQGWEKPMVLVGVIFWIGWHIVQVRMENKHYKDMEKKQDPKEIEKSINRY